MLASLRESLASHSSFFPNNSLLRHQLTKIKFLQQYGEVLNWWRLRRIPGIRRILSIPMRFLRKLFYLKKTFLSRNFSIEWLGNEDSSKESLESEESLASEGDFLGILFHFRKPFRITSFFLIEWYGNNDVYKESLESLESLASEWGFFVNCSIKKTLLSSNFSIEWLGNEDSSRESLESEESLASQRGFLGKKKSRNSTRTFHLNRKHSYNGSFLFFF